MEISTPEAGPGEGTWHWARDTEMPLYPPGRRSQRRVHQVHEPPGAQCPEDSVTEWGLPCAADLLGDLGQECKALCLGASRWEVGWLPAQHGGLCNNVAAHLLSTYCMPGTVLSLPYASEQNGFKFLPLWGGIQRATGT